VRAVVRLTAIATGLPDSGRSFGEAGSRVIVYTDGKEKGKI
jgi:hypothetical protein